MYKASLRIWYWLIYWKVNYLLVKYGHRWNRQKWRISTNIRFKLSLPFAMQLIFELKKKETNKQTKKKQEILSMLPKKPTLKMLIAQSSDSFWKTLINYLLYLFLFCLFFRLSYLVQIEPVQKSNSDDSKKVSDQPGKI